MCFDSFRAASGGEVIVFVTKAEFEDGMVWNINHAAELKAPFNVFALS